MLQLQMGHNASISVFYYLDSILTKYIFIKITITWHKPIKNRLFFRCMGMIYYPSTFIDFRIYNSMKTYIHWKIWSRRKRLKNDVILIFYTMTLLLTSKFRNVFILIVRYMVILWCLKTKRAQIFKHKRHVSLGRYL